MASAYVTSGTGTNSASLGSGWSPGDYAIVFAFNDGSTTRPSLPSGWTNIIDGSASFISPRSFRCGYRVLQSGDTTTRTWNNATSVIVVIYRGVLGIGASLFTSPLSGTTTGYAGPLTLQSVSGGSRVICFVGHVESSANNLLNTNAPSGTTRRAHVSDSTDSAAAYETDLLTANYSMPSFTWSSVSSQGHVVLVELRGPIDQVLTGSITAAGAPARKTSKVFDGAVTVAGALAKKTSKALAGAVTAVSDLLVAYIPGGAVYQVLVTGAITATGTVARRTSKALAGAVTAAGALAKKTSKVFDGAVTVAGALAKKTSKALAGAVTAAGALAKKTSKVFDGAVTVAGALAKKTSKVFDGAVTVAGVLFGVYIPAGVVYQVLVTGSITVAGNLSATLLGFVAALDNWLARRRRRRR